MRSTALGTPSRRRPLASSLARFYLIPANSRPPLKKSGLAGKFANRVEQRPGPSSLAFQRLRKPYQVSCIPGVELDHPDLQRLSLVGAAYGVANRTLGAVSLLGPVRMDYEKALRSVRGAAYELSRFVEEIYERN